MSSGAYLPSGPQTLPFGEHCDPPIHRRLQAFVVRRATQAENDPSGRGAALAAMLEHGAGQGRDAEDALDRELCGFLGGVLASRGADIHLYHGAALEVTPERPTDRTHAGCGRRLFTSQVSSRLFVHAPRTLWICERCGNIADAPAGVAPPELRLVAVGRARLDLTKVARGCSHVAASLVPLGRAPGASLLECSIVDARLTIDFARGPADVGLRWIAAAIVWDGQHAIVQVPCYNGSIDAC
jgi:hypothetical protein